MSQNTLGTNEWLLTGQSLRSENGVYKFEMQDDGRIVIHEKDYVMWRNAEERNDVKGIKMQSDGNLVIYTHDGEAVWYTNTAPRDDVILVMQDDGNLVLYQGDAALWASSTTPPV